jgi:hypothetical protein
VQWARTFINYNINIQKVYYNILYLWIIDHIYNSCILKCTLVAHFSASCLCLHWCTYQVKGARGWGEGSIVLLSRDPTQKFALHFRVNSSIWLNYILQLKISVSLPRKNKIHLYLFIFKLITKCHFFFFLL